MNAVTKRGIAAFEIAGAAHEMDRGYFRLSQPAEVGSIRSRSASP
jgi:hypothetical protein